MKKSNLTIIFCLIAFFLSAQDYLVTFSGTGESNEVSSVVVENMLRGKILTLKGTDVLHLKSTITEIPDLVYNQTKGIQFYPNPMKEFTIMEFAMPKEGFATIELFGVSGRKLIQTQNFLNPGKHSYRISGVGNGIYVLKVTASNYYYSGKLVSNKKASEKINITYQNTIPFNDNLSVTKSANSEILMEYKTGDALKFTAIGGEHKSVIVEVISQSKNIAFTFYKCTDLDSRNYATVKIGSQIWMAENLAHLPAVYPSSKGSNTEPIYYVYDYQDTVISTAKQNANYTTYGVLYNWPAAKAACPPGWHLPTHYEWTALEDYLSANGYSYDGKTTGTGIASSLAATTNWNTSSSVGTPGKFLPSNNKSGFSALPGGFQDYGRFRYIGDAGHWWSSTEDSWSSNEAFYSELVYFSTYLTQHTEEKGIGFSVRCVRD